jgi:hypothetical protein
MVSKIKGYVMIKHKYVNTCSCSDIEFKITYECEEAIEQVFCPFCGAEMEEPIEVESDESEYYE